jgi:hypothetical protein
MSSRAILTYDFAQDLFFDKRQSENCVLRGVTLIPEESGIFLEFQDNFPGIPGGLSLLMDTSKICFDVVEPLPGVYLDRI